ncbi:MAG: HIRAN domain-containing protein [Eubacteriales bacterium]|jgi:hypothetical protein
MSDIIKKEDTEIIGLLHGKGGEMELFKPFEKDIYLFDTYIAGTSYVEGIMELKDHIHIDEKVSFFREPDNLHDSHAIVIKNSDGIKLGYVPRKDNEVFSRLMDAGKLLFGKITAKEVKNKWLKLDIKVYLHE